MARLERRFLLLLVGVLDLGWVRGLRRLHLALDFEFNIYYFKQCIVKFKNKEGGRAKIKGKIRICVADFVLHWLGLGAVGAPQGLRADSGRVRATGGDAPGGWWWLEERWAAAGGTCTHRKGTAVGQAEIKIAEWGGREKGAQQ